MSEQTQIRYNVFNTLVENTHKDFDRPYSILTDVRDRDPMYFSHLTAWLRNNSKVRDLIRVSVAAAAKSDEWEFMVEHRDIAAAIIRDMSARELWFVLDLIRNQERSHRNQRYAKIPQTICTEVQKWWNDLVASGQWERVVLSSRKYVQDIHRWCHLRRDPIEHSILFENARPEGTIFAVLTQLENTDDVYDRAKLIMEHNIPFLVGSTFLPMSEPETWVALIETSSANQLTNMWKSLERAGAFENREVKRLAEEKLRQKAKTDKRFQASKAEIFTDSEVAQEAFSDMLENYEITRPTAIIVDISQSMQRAIEVARRQGRNIARMCGDDVPVVFFNSDTTLVVGNANDWDSVFRGIRADGMTYIGAPLRKLMNNYRSEELPDQLVFITDQEETCSTARFQIVNALQDYVRALSPRLLNVVVVHVGSIPGRRSYNDVEAACITHNVECTVIKWGGDYTAEQNLYKLLSGRSASKYDIVDEIMETPLPVRRE